MSRTERTFIVVVLLSIILMVSVDLISDSKEGARWWHLGIEATAGIFAAIGVAFILKDSFKLRNSLAVEKDNSAHWRAESEKWRMQSKKYLQGLSSEIDRQLGQWNLTKSEKEVGFLLLKGLSLKEIAELRGTTEKTARVQSTAIYQKAGLAGRSEFAAFFLEDLLVPQEELNS